MELAAKYFGFIRKPEENSDIYLIIARMGYIIDHIRPGRLGRFRTVLLIGTVVCTLNYALLWFGPLYAGSTLLKLIIAYISYILIGITFDLMVFAVWDVRLSDFCAGGDHPGQLIEQAVWVYGLGCVAVHPGREAAGDVLLVGVRRHRDDRNAPGVAALHGTGPRIPGIFRAPRGAHT